MLKEGIESGIDKEDIDLNDYETASEGGEDHDIEDGGDQEDGHQGDKVLDISVVKGTELTVEERPR